MALTHDASASVYSALITINREAFAGAQYEVAYHALAAAWHSACDDSDHARVRDIQGIALRQGAWIDTHRPEHRLSSASAKARGQPSLFSMLERQANAADHIDFATRHR
jgi:hypothetical protein